MKFTTALNKFLNGEIKYQELATSDDLIYEITPFGSKYKTKIILNFDSVEDYFNLFDLEDYDVSDATSLINNSYYYNSDIFTSEDAYYDYKSGYIFGSFNDENIEILKKIFQLIGPEYIPYLGNFQDESKNEEIVGLLEKFTNNQKKDVFSNIIDEYQRLIDESMRESIIGELENEFCDILGPYSIKNLGQCFHSYITSAGALNALYERYGNDEELTLTELLKKFTKNLSVMGNFYDLRYEAWGRNFDTEEFNQYVEPKLEEYYEYLLETLETSSELPEIVEFLNKNFGFGKYFKVPGKPINIRINTINHENNTIIITVFNTEKQSEKTYAPDIQTFMSYLYNHDLFELGVD